MKTYTTCMMLIAAVFLSMNVNAAQQLYYIHSDHLNTPQALTDSNQQVVWRVEQQTPFGEVEVDEDPDGDGEDVVFNLRFPGQYFDEETNTNYNYYRTYNPSLGRYIQSDPIGLKGGINAYGYSYQNPVNYKDPDGLTPATAGGCMAGAWAGLLGCGIGAAVGNVITLGVGLALGYQNLTRDDLTPEQEALKEAEYEWYKTQCNTPPVKTGNYCEDLKNEIQRAQLCAELRSQWDQRWMPGRHDTEIQREQQRAQRLREEYEKNCKSECE